MRGSVYKRCQCRDENGKRVKGCRKMHGSWAYTVDAGADPRTGRRRQRVRSGFRTREEAEDARTRELGVINAGIWTDDRGVTVGARSALDRHRRVQQEERNYLGDGYVDHDLIFCDYAGLPLRPGGVTIAFKAHAGSCGLPLVRLHDTRHGACSLLVAGGVPIEVVQMILGHSSPEVTRRVYAHLMRKATAAQVESAAELLTRHRRQIDDEPDVGASGAGQDMIRNPL